MHSNNPSYLGQVCFYFLLIDFLHFDTPWRGYSFMTRRNDATRVLSRIHGNVSRSIGSYDINGQIPRGSQRKGFGD